MLVLGIDKSTHRAAIVIGKCQTKILPIQLLKIDKRVGALYFSGETRFQVTIRSQRTIEIKLSHSNIAVESGSAAPGKTDFGTQGIVSPLGDDVNNAATIPPISEG